MLVSHAVWHGGALCLWAERSGPWEAMAPGVHPFATTDFVRTDYTRLLRDSARISLDLLLPTANDHPVPSPELGSEPLTTEPELSGWQVPALVLEPFAATALLMAADHLNGVLPGTDLRYLGILAAEAERLAARGQVLPALVREDGEPVARWRPVLDDHGRLSELAAAMPSACRAADPDRPVSELLSEALSALTDTAVRGRVPDPLLPRRTGRVPDRLPLSERWVAALTGPVPEIEQEPGDEREEPGLVAELEAWARSARRPPGPLRVCFRLVEPPDPELPMVPETPETPEAPEAPEAPELSAAVPPLAGRAGRKNGAEPAGAGLSTTRTAAAGLSTRASATGDDAVRDDAVRDDATGDDDGSRWRIEFALQGTDDLSLYLPAPAIWSGETTSIAEAEETLLAGLGRALKIFPELAPALNTALPCELVTDTAGAFCFLRESAPMLSAAGYGVLLPQWAGRTGLGLRLSTRTAEGTGDPGAVVGSGFGMEQLVDFRWDLAIGGESIDEEQLAELARLKAPLIRHRGKWVELDEAQLTAALDFLQQRRTGRMTAAEALAATLHAGDETLPLLEVEADGPLGDLLSGEADRRLSPMTTPDGFKGRLRPYQERGLAWLTFMNQLGLGALLADDMGLGKTLAVLSLLVHERAAAHEAGSGAVRPTLAIVPMSLVGNWQREAAKFAPDLRIYVHHGTGRHRGDDLAEAVGRADLILTTYGTAARDTTALAGIDWGRIVCDEAQALKNSGTRQARAVRAIPAPSRIALTGTPVENHLTELWSIMEFANPGLLGPREVFRRRFAIPIEQDGDERAAAGLKRATGPFVLRRLKTDTTIISDLPDKEEIKVYCNLTPEQASLYQATVDDMLEQIAESDGTKRRGLVLAAMAKLKQVCNHPAHLLKDGTRLDGRSGKLERLEEICAEVMEQGEKALAFTQYAEFGSMLQPYLASRLGRPVLWLHGGTPKARRDELIQRFQEDDEPAVFLLSLKAAGTGLTLTAANHVIHIDRWWNPAVEDQATDRAFRIGQTRNVQVRKFICVGTLEERIDEMIERKKALADSVVGTGEDWLTELSVAELRDVIRLSPEAVSD